MNTEIAETYALNEVIRRLKLCPSYYSHDPFCSCFAPERCTNRVKLRLPNENAVQPYRDYENALSEITKSTIKKLLLKGDAPVKKDPLLYMFITINPKPSITFDNFYKKLNIFLNTKLFDDYCAVVEQRGTPTKDLGKGFHTHILFKRHTPLKTGLPPSNIIQKIKTSWKNYLNINNSQIFNVQVINETFAIDKLEYMLGVKTQPGKKEKQDGDKLFRYKNKIPKHLGKCSFHEKLLSNHNIECPDPHILNGAEADMAVALPPLDTFKVNTEPLKPAKLAEELEHQLKQDT